MTRERASQILAEAETAQAIAADLERLNNELAAIASAQSDALVAALSLLGLTLGDARAIGFCGDVVGAVRETFNALERSQAALSGVLVALGERGHELGAEVERLRRAD